MTTDATSAAEVSPPELRTFVTEKKLGLGEDGPPLAVSIKSLGDVVAVFDGMGGAGAVQVPSVEDENKLRTMAYVASNATSLLIGGKLRQWGKGSIQDLQLELNIEIPRRLTELAERSNGRGMKPGLKGTLLQEYPTTIAIGFVQNSVDNLRRTVSALWAGDSRICVFDPDLENPLQILTRDHTSEGGGGDAALGRFASASGLDLEYHSVLAGPHSAVIAITDGCYGYMSDFDLMYLIVNSLQLSRDIDEWILIMKQQISEKAGDDAALSISLGVGGYQRLRQLTASRLDEFHDLRNVPQNNPYVSVFRAESFRLYMSKEDVGTSSDSLAVQPADVSVETEPVVVPVNVDAPVVDAPVVDAPVVDAPVVDAPVVDAPVVDAPVVEANLKTNKDEDDSFFDKLNPFSKKK